MASLPGLDGTIKADPETVAPWKEPTPFWDAVDAGLDDATMTRNTGAREEATRAALWERHKRIERNTGQKLTPSLLMLDVGEHHTYQIPADTVGGRVAQMFGQGPDTPNAPTDADYEARLSELRAKNPAAFANIEDRAALKAALDKRFKAVRTRADEAGGVGVFVGQAVGAMADPLNLGAMMSPGGGLRSVAGRLLEAGAQNAASEVTQIPGRIEDTKFGGPEYTAGEAVLDVGAASVGGVAFQGLGEAAKAGAKRVFRPSERAVMQHVLPGGATARAADILDQGALDDTAIGLRSGEEHERALVSLAQLQPPPRVEPDRDLTEMFTGGERVTDYRGRPISSLRFDPMALETDAVRFQYKADGDAQGVTARLRGVEAWDPTAAGQVIVFEDRAGARFIADGHQRRGLAVRMNEKGWDAQLDGFLFREADGWTAPEVRTVAALKNIREGAGSPLDAAKVFRDAPDALRDRSLPVSGEFIAQGRGLAQLSDDAFGAAVNKVIPERYASEIGQMAAHRPDLHMDMVRLMKAADPANGDEARALIVEALQDDWIKHDGDQVDLFGYDASQSAMIGRAKIAASVKRALARDANLFRQLVKNADAIEAGGNALARDANEARLALDRTALEVTARLALRHGPIGEAMAEAVAKVARGENPATASKDVLKRVREAVEAGESFEAARTAAIDPKAPSPASRDLLDAFDDPAGDGAKAQAVEAVEDAADDSPGLFDDLPEVTVHERARASLTACMLS